MGRLNMPMKPETNGTTNKALLEKRKTVAVNRQQPKPKQEESTKTWQPRICRD